MWKGIETLILIATLVEAKWLVSYQPSYPRRRKPDVRLRPTLAGHRVGQQSIFVNVRSYSMCAATFIIQKVCISPTELFSCVFHMIHPINSECIHQHVGPSKCVLILF